MTTFVIVAVLFIFVGFVLGFFLTSRAANKNQGQMKHCQSCQFFKSWHPYVPSASGDPQSDFSGMSDEQYKSYLEHQKEG